MHPDTQSKGSRGGTAKSSVNPEDTAMGALERGMHLKAYDATSISSFPPEIL